MKGRQLSSAMGLPVHFAALDVTSQIHESQRKATNGYGDKQTIDMSCRASVRGS